MPQTHLPGAETKVDFADLYLVRHSLKGIRKHHEFTPADAPDPADPDIAFGIPPAQITTQLLDLCSEFFRQANPLVRAELRDFLTERGYHPSGLGWFLDALGLTTLDHSTPDDNVA